MWLQLARPTKIIFLRMSNFQKNPIKKGKKRETSLREREASPMEENVKRKAKQREGGLLAWGLGEERGM